MFFVVVLFGGVVQVSFFVSLFLIVLFACVLQVSFLLVVWILLFFLWFTGFCLDCLFAWIQCSVCFCIFRQNPTRVVVSLHLGERRWHTFRI